MIHPPIIVSSLFRVGITDMILLVFDLDYRPLVESNFAEMLKVVIVLWYSCGNGLLSCCCCCCTFNCLSDVKICHNCSFILSYSLRADAFLSCLNIVWSRILIYIAHWLSLLECSKILLVSIIKNRFESHFHVTENIQPSPDECTLSEWSEPITWVRGSFYLDNPLSEFCTVVSLFMDPGAHGGYIWWYHIVLVASGVMLCPAF